MATQIFLTIDGVQGDSDAPDHQGSFTVSTFDLHGPTGGVQPGGGGVVPNDLHGPTGGATMAAPALLIVTIPGGQSLAPLSGAFAVKRKFAGATLTIDQPDVRPIVFNFKDLVVVGISGIADEDGAEYQVTFNYGSVSAS